MSNKLNETFQKHLKLLHKHLNINEAYGDAAHINWVMRDPGQRPDWDPDGLTGIKQPSYRPSRNYDPEEEEREKYSNSVAGYARNNGFDVNSLIRYLNLIKQNHRNNWKVTDKFIGSWMYDSDKFDKQEYKRWADREDRDYERRRKKDKEEAPAREINNAAENIRMEMTELIHSIGTIRWQVFKLKNPEEKLKYLSDYFEKNEDKLKDYGKLGPDRYNDIKPYFDKYSNNDEKAKLILLTAIKKVQNSDIGRGFFEQ